jgi:hypothetical protein
VLRKLIFPLTVFALLVLIAVAVWHANTRLQAVWHLYYGHDAFKALFYNGWGVDDSLASLLSTISAFFYASAIIGFATCTVVFFRRFTPRQWIAGLASFVILYSVVPLAHVISDGLGRIVCFNQTTGEPLKWYVIRAGKIQIFDSRGFDPVDGSEKKQATVEVCRAYEYQRSGLSARELNLTEAMERIPNVWFQRKGDRLVLYDSQFVMPGTNELAKLATPEVTTEIRKRIETQRREEALAEKRRQDQVRQDAERQQAEEKAAKGQQDAEVARQAQQAAQARRVQLAKLLDANAATLTGYECSISDDGFAFEGVSSETVKFSDTKINVDRINFKQTDGSLDHSALAVRVLGPSFKQTQQCLVYVIEPMPDSLDLESAARLDSVLDILASLNATILNRRPNIESRAVGSAAPASTQASPSWNPFSSLISVTLEPISPIFLPSRINSQARGGLLHRGYTGNSYAPRSPPTSGGRH